MHKKTTMPFVAMLTGLCIFGYSIFQFAATLTLSIRHLQHHPRPQVVTSRRRAQQLTLTSADIESIYGVQTVHDLSGVARSLWCPQAKFGEPNATVSPEDGWSEIPRRVVQIGSSSVLASLEPAVKEGILSWLFFHPCYSYVFLDDDAMSTFMSEKSSRIKAAFRQLANGGERADFARYLFMFEHGGIYADTDTTALRPISTWNLRLHDSLVVGLEADFKDERDAETWVYARKRSASLHTFATSKHNEVLGRVITRVLDNIEHPELVLQAVHARAHGLPSHLETIFKTGPGPFSDVVLSDLKTTVLSLYALSGKHSQGQRFFNLQRQQALLNQTVLVAHANLGSW